MIRAIPVSLGAFLFFLISSKASAAFGHTDQAQGFYAKGSLQNASSLPLEGNGFLKILRPRKRWFATDVMIDTLTKVGKFVTIASPKSERLQVGDICQEKGGFLSGHDSHQNGLDADIVYLRHDHREMPVDTTDGFDETFVVNHQLTANFDVEHNWQILRFVVSTGRIGRIFVDPVIKKTFCLVNQNSKDPIDVETLRRLRPLANHDDHFHMRLLCPSGSPQCIGQADPAPDTGCSALLNGTPSVETEDETEAGE